MHRMFRSRSITDFRAESLARSTSAQSALTSDTNNSSCTSLESSHSDIKSSFSLDALPKALGATGSSSSCILYTDNDAARVRLQRLEIASADTSSPLLNARSFLIDVSGSRVLEPSDVVTWNAVQHEPTEAAKFDSPAGSKVNIAPPEAEDSDKPGPAPVTRFPPLLERRPTAQWQTASAAPAPAPVSYPRTYDSMGSMWDYFRGELFGSDFDEIPDVKKERIQNFLSVPYELEKFMLFGCVICFDSFLHIFTILPLRLMIAVCTLLKGLFTSRTHLNSSQKCDLMRGALIVITCYMLQRYDASRIYHSVRGQALIKLYVIFNSLEICDKLCSAFGHDILDSLFSKATVSYSLQNPQHTHRNLGRVKHFLVALCYVFTHSIVLFYQVMTLNVAVNSYNNALLTLLMSNQFVEIKGSVFKRFERENLFQLSCADIVERFQLAVFLCIITLRNLIELTGGLSNSDSAISYFYTLSASMFAPSTFLTADIPTASSLLTMLRSLLATPAYKLFETLATPVIVVFGTEILVDWLKHAFISKFNQIKPAVYGRFKDSLCRDLVGARIPLPSQSTTDPIAPLKRAHVFVDQSPAVARRIGFVSIPLSCLVIRVTVQTMHMLFFLRTSPLDPEAAGPTLASRKETAFLIVEHCLDTWRTSIPADWATAPWQETASILRDAGLKVGRIFIKECPWNAIRDWAVEVGAWVLVGMAVYLSLLVLKLIVGMSMHRAARQRCQDMDASENSASAQHTSGTATPQDLRRKNNGSTLFHPPPPSTFASRRPSVAGSGVLPFETVSIPPPPVVPKADPKLDGVDRFTMVKSRIV
ncbi:hypothetical protein HKX48_004587 [Thoreauomyces humboldtii]|nr:hypothetical protein HKX48_004587 [Thoreauomyces humboldtii]